MNDAVSAKAQVDAQAVQDAARAQAAASASSNPGGCDSASVRRGCNGYRAPPITVVATIVHSPEEVTHQVPKEGTAIIPLGPALQTALQVLFLGKETICMLTLSSNTF